MKRIIDAQQAIQRIVWPYQNNRTSIAGGSRALFLAAGMRSEEDLSGTIPGSLAESARISG